MATTAATKPDMDSVSESSAASEKDEKPLALRKTPRVLVGQNLYRCTTNQSPAQTIAKPKENVDSPSTPATKRGSQSSETKTETPTEGSRNKRKSEQSAASSGKRKKPAVTETEHKHDSYCWKCHKEGVLVGCEVCPRAYHIKCASLDKDPDRDWVCAECDLVLKAENVDLRSNAMRALTVDQLCNLLKFAVSRMRMQCPDEFLKPVPLEVFPNYFNFVVHPMDLETLDKNIKQRMYGCTESFISDTKWILHNCIIFNGYQHKLTSMAKALLKICKYEMSEIEVCPDCYSNAYTKRENWFQEPCCPPHLLIWAKLKGFPFWPAKAMRIITGNVDVRFFGAHDRAWIPASQCFLLSSEIPTSMKVKKKSVFEHSMEELSQHITKVKERFQVFQYAAFRSPLVATDLNIHIQSMLPGVNLKDYCRSSVGTFRYQGSPFSPKERQAIGFVAQSKGIKQESSSPFCAPVRVALNKASSDGAKHDHSRMVKPRLECMKKLEVAIEKIKSFGKDYDAMLNRKSPSEASTSTPSSVQQEAGKVSVEMDKDSKDKGLAFLIGANETASSQDVASPDGEQELDAEQSDSLPSTSTDACEVSSTTCVPEATSFVEESGTSSPSTGSSNVPIAASKSLENPVETKLNKGEGSDTSAASPPAVNPENIVPIKDVVSVESEDATTMPVVESDAARQEEDGTPSTVVGHDSQSSVPTPLSVSGEDRLALSPVSAMEEEEVMDTDESQPIKTGSNNSDDKIPERSSDKGSLREEEEEEEEMEEESLRNGKGEESAEINADSNPGSSPMELQDDRKAESEVSSDEKKDEGKEDVGSEDTNDAKSDGTDSSAAKDSESKESGMDLSPSNLADEGDLVIDLDRDKEEEAQNPTKAKKRNTRSPFGGIKLKEKSPPKDKRQQALPPKAKGKSNPSSERHAPDVAVGCPPAAPVGNASRICTNLPMLSPLGLRNSVSVLQSQQVSRSMPTLQPRPSISVSSPESSGSAICHPSPGSSTGLNKYSQKMVDFVRGTMEEMFHDLAKTGNPEATIKTLQLEMEKMQWHHQQEMAEMKHNTDLILLEMRNSLEAEKQRFIADVRRQCEIDKQKSIEETKKKQWCAYCGKEAIFYCCWNTSYCDYPCQQAHWPRHVNVCSQTQAGGEHCSKDSAAENGMANGGGSKSQGRKQGAKNSKKSEQTSEQQQQHPQIYIGHPHVQPGSGPLATALTSVQVIPQTNMRGGLQVQYLGGSPQTSGLPTITMQTPTMGAQYTTVATPSGYPIPQGMSGAAQGAVFQQRPMQGSNLLFPVVSTHQNRPIMHPNHLPQNTQILVSHGMRSQPSLSFIRGASHPHRGRPYMM